MGLTEMPERDRAERDRGAMLILTLLLSVVLSVIVMSIATYAAAGLRTSRVATERTNGNAAATSALTWATEELSAKRLTPDDCDGAELAVPAGIVDGAELSVTCVRTVDLNENPTVVVRARATIEGRSHDVDARIQVPAASYDAVVAEWSAIASLSVDPFVPPTTSAPTTTAPASTATPTTTTTSTTVAPTTSTTTTLPPTTTTSTTTTTTTTTSTTTTTTVPPTTTTEPRGAVTCSFWVSSAWRTGATGWVTITNDSDERIDGWTVAIEHDGHSIRLWNASRQSSDRTEHSGSSLGWNRTVNARSWSTPTGGTISGLGIEQGDTFGCRVVGTG